jgi:hypothetical protein
MICIAVIVVPLVVPSTRTGWPFVTALAEAECVRVSYFVEGVSCTVTFWPAEVDTVKLDVETLPTVPTVPPAAGPDRAFDLTAVVVAVSAAAELLPAVALTIPYAPPPTARTVATTAMDLVSFRENMSSPSRDALSAP